MYEKQTFIQTDVSTPAVDQDRRYLAVIARRKARFLRGHLVKINYHEMNNRDVMSMVLSRQNLQPVCDKCAGVQTSHVNLEAREPVKKLLSSTIECPAVTLPLTYAEWLTGKRSMSRTLIFHGSSLLSLVISCLILFF